ncbi:carboxypeptidase-like regulatory domain-containing protein [Eisenibacter elegans]|uniref:carboxypeptidase-like regulatory domain-containing protein n=1 Tax=Eisenibacter elegans TaxID=997 RepID=UPI0004184C25|nr:carboxypeptidase-like regulatory domain-containing protein [Eisenibacter elegans]
MKTLLRFLACLLGFLLIFCVRTAFAQDLVLQGTVRDAQTKEAIPYASIYIKGSNIGTASNSEGFFVFKVPEDLQSGILVVSYIGHESFQIPLRAVQKPEAMEILLQESATTLKEVSISAASAAQIVAKASERIPLNYPLSNTLYTGFYRESNLHHQKDSPERYFYVIEAVIKHNKPSYKSPLPAGDIKIEKVRKEQFVGDSTKFSKWAAGAFTPIRFDAVKKRFDFLRPSTLSRYTYTLEDYTTYQDREVYQISFQPAQKSADYEGTMYIDTESYAIVKVDYQYSPEGLRRENQSRNYTDLLQRRFRVNYQALANNRWYLQSLWQEAKGYDRKAKDYYRYQTEYASTRIDTNRYEKFEYADKIQFEEVFLTKNDAYDENFWKDYNLVAETQSLKSILIDTSYQLNIRKEQEANASQKATRKPLSIRSLFSFDTYLLQAQAQNVQFQYSNAAGSFALNESQDLPTTRVAWGSSFGIEVDVYKDFYITFQGAFGFSRAGFSGVDLGSGHRFLLNKPKKRSIYLITELAYTNTRLLFRIADYNNNNAENIAIEGTTFDKETVRAEYLQRQSALKLRLGLEVELERNILAFVQVGYFIPLQESHSLLFSDKNEFGLVGMIGQRRKEVDFDNPRAAVQQNGQESRNFLFNNLLFFNVGFKWNLKLRL